MVYDTRSFDCAQDDKEQPYNPLCSLCLCGDLDSGSQALLGNP